MADATYQPKVYFKQGGDELVVASGGTLTVESGATVDLASGVTAVGDLALTTGSIVIGAAGVGAALDVKTSGRILVGNGTTGVSVAVSGDATLASSGALTVTGVGGTALTATGTEINKLAGATVTTAEINLLDNQVAGAVQVVGAQGGDIINVAIQLNDAAGTAMANRNTLFAYLSNDANGDSIVPTAHSTSPAIGTDGLLMPVITDKAFYLTSEADGDIDINFEEAGALGPYYLVIVLPNGSRSISAAITHT